LKERAVIAAPRPPLKRCWPPAGVAEWRQEG